MTQTKGVQKHSVNYTEEDIVGYYVRQWVMEWVKKYHPEAFKEAEKFVKEYLKDEDLIFYDSWQEDKLFVRYDSTIEINKNYESK